MSRPPIPNVEYQYKKDIYFLHAFGNNYNNNKFAIQLYDKMCLEFPQNPKQLIKINIPKSNKKDEAANLKK